MRASCACCGGLTESEEKDYYAILGLDHGASPESIKLAYRRLARENHPDLVQQLGPEALEQASALMRAINEAYAVLSHARTRQEYDGSAHGAASAAAVTIAEADVAIPRPAVRARARADAGVMSSVISMFSQEFRRNLTVRSSGFKWHEKQCEGFDWVTKASFWNAVYYVGLRGFALADLHAATKFTNYCDLAIARNRSLLKPTYFLFVIPFQKASGGDAIAALLRRFCANAQGERTPGAARIIMMDLAAGKALVCGTPLPDGRYEGLVKRVLTRHSA